MLLGMFMGPKIQHSLEGGTPVLTKVARSEGVLDRRFVNCPEVDGGECGYYGEAVHGPLYTDEFRVAVDCSEGEMMGMWKLWCGRVYGCFLN
jgi:hypothetical protein